MSKITVAELDEGQLGFMWNFLQFKGKDLNISDIKALEFHLDLIRNLMVAKKFPVEMPKRYRNYGEHKKMIDENGYDLQDLGTLVNLVVIEAMSIYLSGGLEILKQSCESEEEDNE